ncbi:DUF5667 domain-containing protein [Patescibacteria group bacterium]
MTEQELINLLNRAKDAPELGADPEGLRSKALWNRISSELKFDLSQPVRHYAFGDYVEFWMHQFSSVVVRPLAVGVSVFALVMVGWIGTVNASFDSLPGDKLYPVKLATERVRLTFASSGGRAKLHTEFAGRRLQEAVDLGSSSDQERHSRVKAAMAQFEQELVFAGESLAKVQGKDLEGAANIAAEINQKANEYEAVLTQNSNDSVEMKEAIENALDAVDETAGQTIDTLVTTHEQDQEAVKDPLGKSFQNEFKNLKDRTALSLGRLEVVTAVLTESEILNQKDYSERITQVKYMLLENDGRFREATDLYAAGGMRKAFELLGEIRTRVELTEKLAIELEIDITTTQMPVQEEVQEQITEPEETADVQTEELETSQE